MEWVFQRQAIFCEAAQNLWCKKVEALKLYLYKGHVIDDRSELESR